MEAATLYIIEIAFALTALGILTGYLVTYLKKPKNYLIVMNGRSYIPIRIKKPGAVSQTWTDPATKKPINFPLHPSFSYQDKKGGLRFLGDPKTGLLVRFNAEAADFEYMDPRYPIQALQDGRPLQIIRSLAGEPVWTQYILPALIVVGLLGAATLFMVYKIYSSAHGGA